MEPRVGPRRARLRRAVAPLALVLALPLLPAMVAPERPLLESLEPEVLRSCDLPSTGELPPSERLIVGLAAHACADASSAVDLLAGPASTAGLEDWRLFAIATAAVETEDLALASATADALLRDHPRSPLRHRAYALRARVALLAGEYERTLTLARAARAEAFPEALATELDILAWEAARALDRSVDVRLEASQLLIRSPSAALDLGVADVLRRPDGTVPWGELFAAHELLLRAERLLAAGLLQPASVALAAIPPAERRLDWTLLNARLLIEDRRGAEAFAALAAAAPDEESRTELAWLRAEAALDAATVRRGRRNLPSDQRLEMRHAAHFELRQIVRQDSGRHAIAALERLFEELADGEHFDEVLGILARLRALDPADTTGVRYMWRLGWHEYNQRNYSGAIGYWSELAGLYPENDASRAARYWSARAHDKLGNRARAEALLEEVAAAGATDYYRKHALLRLGRQIAPATAEVPQVPWPSDPRLARAEQLSAIGIDRLGLEELEMLTDSVEQRAAAALRSRILARMGRRRESIQTLRPVFPALGTAQQAAAPAEALRMYYPVDFLPIVERFAGDNRLPVPLLLAMIRQESAFDVQARSFAGARGLMQVMPATARELAGRLGLPYSSDQLDDPGYSVQLGSRYFRQVLDMFDGDIELALAGYNAGPYRIRKLVQSAGPGLEVDAFLEGLNIEESKIYVKRVVLFANSYEQLYPELG